MIKLEDYPAPLVVHDYYVLCHLIKRDVTHFSKRKDFEQIIKAIWALRINRGPDALPIHPHYRMLIVKDRRYLEINNYWRQLEIQKDERMELVWEMYWENNPQKEQTSEAYKGTRGEKDDIFKIVDSVGYNYLNKYFNIYYEEGYEADDLAGAIYRISRDTNSICRQRQIFFHTNDRDWGQLVDDFHKCYWANTRYPRSNEKIQHRIAGNKEVLEHTEYKHNLIIKHPKELINAKTVNGDWGDNCPPGTPTDYMDLCEPPHKYKPEKLVWFERMLNEDLNNPDSNVRLDHYYQAKEQLLRNILYLPKGNF